MVIVMVEGKVTVIATAAVEAVAATVTLISNTAIPTCNTVILILPSWPLWTTTRTTLPMSLQ